MLTAVSVLCFAGCGNTDTSDKEEVSAADAKAAEPENLIIPLSGVSETASFYPVTVDGTEMEVLAIKDSSGNIRTARIVFVMIFLISLSANVLIRSRFEKYIESEQ